MHLARFGSSRKLQRKGPSRGPFVAPEAAGIDLVVRALGVGRSDLELFVLTDAIFDGIYATFTAG